MRLAQRLDLYERLMRLDKPIGILLLAWPTLWALWISSTGQPNWIILWIFMLGTVLMRSAGCVINDFADRDFDPHVERTRNRPMAAGLVSKKEALALFSILSICAFLLILRLNKLTIMLSFAALFLAASYPFTKRFLAIPQAYLGIAFGFGIPMAFAAQTGAVPAIAWLMLLANVFWAVAYDTEYAMVDREDDLKIGIRTSAITFGQYDVLAVLASYGMTLALLAGVGAMLKLGLYYYLGLAVALAIAAYHYTLIRGRERDKCFKAFIHNNWFGAAIFGGILLNYWQETSLLLRSYF
ncbi:MAG: 4-hydroxybenzoate octaprenyltransferase [Sulfurimicrobium sp.]|nr:4-hydroxybenzoate octaprenyltransferase [Sulfurimicrobium sp.]MDO9191198.1 4-hydroxybenzoate octaprenyltransferase [Sulfurimicrobium sp.]MDP1896662.1 4-hydroxybenzoate octaprenyltransferase [Sulfurimicrobium sp.]MDP2198156.1 4-hydroxybenzoate octaprenyltransferase [Sulfurimicrobium sp.]MDP2962670.1 4-hydroxybenzoate octaprenyltransferase [Sulfurimicrobium sp.]